MEGPWRLARAELSMVTFGLEDNRGHSLVGPRDAFWDHDSKALAPRCRSVPQRGGSPFRAVSVTVAAQYDLMKAQSLREKRTLGDSACQDGQSGPLAYNPSWRAFASISH